MSRSTGTYAKKSAGSFPMVQDQGALFTSQTPSKLSTDYEKPSNSSPETPEAEKPDSIMTNSRSHLKRKAKDLAPVQDRPDLWDLMKEALKPFERRELEEWEAWIELESEPAFFNIMLKELGVPDIRAHELFLVDEDSLANLPKPVYGLIFCYQYYPTDDNTQDEENTHEVWFANQTIDNACASVALLNTIMNVPNVRLGPELQQFKDSTNSLDTSLRGHALGKNSFIRSIHNSFSKRMDHLNADLCLENAASAPTPKAARAKKGNRKMPQRKKVQQENGFHFVAFVPLGGKAWELDGMKSKPRHLGSFSEGSEWTSCVAPEIQARMIEHQEFAVAFSLLGLCASPLLEQSKRVSSSIASLRRLHERLDHSTAFKREHEKEAHLIREGSDVLSTFELTSKDVEEAPITSETKNLCDQEIVSDGEATSLHTKLLVEIQDAMAQYGKLMNDMAEEEALVQGRRKDYAPAIHRWVTSLANKGLLEDLIRNS